MLIAKSFKNNIFIIMFLLVFPFVYCGGSSDNDELPDSIIGKEWTIMLYGDGDNNLEDLLLIDIDEMKAGFVNDQGINLIVLADRLNGDSAAGLNERFTDTRMYRISHGKATRIEGSSQFPEITATSNYEANMGDAITLQKFIQSCMSNFPADNYALILWNHGSGPEKKKMAKSLLTPSPLSSDLPFKGICVDESNGNDILYTAEITDKLTSGESVDLLGFDACIMGSVEVAYQYRPGNVSFSANYMVASPANEWGYGWDYENILKRLRSDLTGDSGGSNDVTGGGNEQYYNPASMSALDLGGIIVEEQYDSTSGIDNDQTLSCYDLLKVDAVKTAVDDLSMLLDSKNEKDAFENIRGGYMSAKGIFYFDDNSIDEWVFYPFFDLYDISYRTNVDTANFSLETRTEAETVMNAVDNMILYSFAGNNFPEFLEGKNGLYIFFPDGDEVVNGDFDDDTADESVREWTFQWWYNEIDALPMFSGYSDTYGKLDWCINDKDGNNTSTIDIVENWFELLDKWFDYTVGDWPPAQFGGSGYPLGGVNSYQY